MIKYRRTGDNVGFEVIDTDTGDRVHPTLIFSEAEAQEIVRRKTISRRGVPKKFRHKNKKPKGKVIQLRR